MANSYRVLRTFPAGQTLRRGQVVQDPNWRNLGLLVKQGYLELVGGAEIPPQSRKNELPNHVEMDNNSDLEMIEADKPHVEHPEKSIEALAGPADGETDIEVVAENVGGEAFIPDEVANTAKPAARTPAVKTKSKEKKNGRK